MYSKREVCFTITLALGVCFSFNPRQDTVRLSSHGSCFTLVDGVHPPPPTQPPPKFGSQGQLQADGVHPPPPTQRTPKIGNGESLQTAGTEPLLPLWLSDSRSAS